MFRGRLSQHEKSQYNMSAKGFMEYGKIEEKSTCFYFKMFMAVMGN